MATQYTAGLTTGQVLTAATMNSIGAVYETWTPNVRPETGAWTTGVLEYARYGRIQNLVYGYLYYRITAFGTGNNNVLFDLPVTMRNVTLPVSIGGGRESQASGDWINVFANGTTQGVIRRYNNTSVANGNNWLPIFFMYEAA